MASQRAAPNILITGTPGTGKTTTAAAIAQAAQLTHLNVGELVREQGLHCGWDAEFEAHILDEDKIVDALEDTVSSGGCIVDHHSCDFFPERWFDLVVVLQTDNGVLFDRLTARGYNERKVSENVQCEIMMVLTEEAYASYRKEIVVPLCSNSVDDMDSNVDRCVRWVEAYRQQQRGS